MDLPLPSPAAGGSPWQSARLLRLASDDRLVALLRRGNRAAFEVVYDRHHRAILSFCRHMLGNHQDAEDVVQHTFLAAHTAVGRSTERTNLSAWLFTIARNRCLDVIRGRHEVPSGSRAEPSTAGLAADVERRDELRLLLGDIARLPHDQRAALLLSELSTLPHTEIAGVIGVPTAKVKALVFQARQNLTASREAREIGCAPIREQIATDSPGVLRRAPVRRHLATCPGCQDYRDEVRRQHRALAAVLPVTPTVALKANVLHCAMGGGTAAALAGSTAAAGGLSTAVLAKVGALVVLAGGGATVAVTAVDHHRHTRGSAVHAAPAGRLRPLSQSPTAALHARPALSVNAAGSRARHARPPGAHHRHPPSTPPGRAGKTRSSAAHQPGVHGSPSRAPSASAAVGTGAGGSSAAQQHVNASAAGHRSSTGATHAATPVRGGGQVQPGINARGPGTTTPAGTTGPEPERTPPAPPVHPASPAPSPSPPAQAAKPDPNAKGS